MWSAVLGTKKVLFEGCVVPSKDSQVHRRNRKQTAQRLVLSGAAGFRGRLEGEAQRGSDQGESLVDGNGNEEEKQRAIP